MSDNIKVVVKVRPLIQRELDAKLGYQWRIHSDTLYQIDQDGKDIGQCFTFDKVYSEDTKTTDVYNDIAKPIVKAATAGINGTIFAYGQTSSGKTYTMSGTPDEPGIIHQAVYDLFDIVKSKEDRDFLLRVSFIEIYNEQVKDLLNVKNEKIKIHETHQGSVRVDVTEKVISTAEEVINVMREGELNRQIGATNMNEMSSRSHSIFQITIESRDHTEGVDEGGSVNISQLNLVDLAGSERAGQTGATGQRFKEGTHINKSLSVLGLVIKQLSEDNSRFANYRDSKLTRILQNSLGGNAKTSIICAVTPAALDETVSTLQFANRAKAIKNKPEVNAVATNASMIQKLTKQLSELQTQLESKKNIEEDMKIIKEKFASLKKQIINGFVRPPDFANQRKTWGKARRVTIDVPRSHEHFVEPEPLRFCTPGLKYNPLSMPGMSDFIPIQKPEAASRLPCVAEEPRSPPPRPAPAPAAAPAPAGDVIVLDSDDDDIPPQQSSGCSPYHKCHGSKTPPCALRERATVAEKNYKCILKLTEREKLYQPSVIELMEKLEQNTTVISKLEVKVESLRKQCDDKEGEMDKLRTEITRAQDEIKTSNTAKTEIETRCEELQTKLTDMEVSFETLRRKAKSREEDLLSLLEEQRAIQNKRNGALTKPEKEINFMDLSTNISLVNSEHENSIIVKDDDTQHVQDMLLTDLQSQITSKNLLITELEAEIVTFKNKISQLEIDNGDIQSKVAILNNEVEILKDDKSILTTTVETLNSTIKNQKENLDTANKDIEAYNELMKEMQAKLEDVSSQVLNGSALETIRANEEQLISNNESFKKIIESLKSAIVIKNEEIDRLKALLNNADTNITKDELKEKNAKIEELLGETNRLNLELDGHIETINKLTNENSNILKSKELLATELTEAIKTWAEANKIRDETMLANKDLSTRVDEMTHLIKELENSIDIKDTMITYLQDNDKTNELMSALNSAVVRIQDAIKSLTGKDIDIDVEDKSDAEFTPLNNVLILLETAHREVKLELEEIRDNREKLLHTLDQHMDAEMDSQIRYETLLKDYNDLTREHQKVKKELAENSESFDDFNKNYQALSSTVEEYRLTRETFQKKETVMTIELENQKQILQEITQQYQILKEENERLLKASTMTHDETLSSKDVEIAELKDKLQEMETELQKQKSVLITEGQKADEQIKSLEQTLQSILDNVINLANSNSIEHQLSADNNNRAEIYKQVPLALDAIVDGLKSVFNKDSNAQIEIVQNALSESEHKMKDLISRNKQLESELERHNRQYQEYLQKLNAMEKDNEVLNNDLTHCNDLIESLKEEINAKKNILDMLEAGTREWKKKFASLERTYREQIHEMQQEKTDLLNKCSLLEAKALEVVCQNTNKIPSEINITMKTPESLLSMCCRKIIDALSMKEEDYQLTSTSSDTTICQCNEMAAKLQQSEVRINILKNAVEHFKSENERLIEERENVRKELDQIVEPADELLKRLATHKTHLATLTNTTYAETRLLKSQVKSLEHHHGNLHNVCQREIQKLKKQLRELYLFLQTEHEKSGMHNSSFKRYSLPIILDSNMTLSHLKNESTLDGDLLMLDTNVTLASTDNTLTCHDQTCYDMTQAYAHNESCPEGSLAPVSIELLMEDNKKMVQKLNHYCEENRKLKEQLDKPSEMSQMRNSSFIEEPVKIVITPCDDAVCENCQDREELVSDLQRLSDELATMKAVKADLEAKYNNLSLEVPSSETLVRKLNALERDLGAKEKLIEKLKHDIESKSRQMDRLQEENDTLSTQIMDNITEVDNIKKELDRLKDSNKDLVVKCEGLKEIAKRNSSKAEIGTPNKLLSNSEILNTSQSNSDASRHILINTLQNQLHASREDCKKITEALSFGQKMDLDDSMGESNIFNFTKAFDSVGNQSMSKFHTMPDIPEERALEYSTDRTDCLSYFLEKTGANKENFQHELKIIDIMKMLYNNLETIHANEVQNLTNRLRQFEENKNALGSQISDLTAKHSSLSEEMEKHKSSAKTISEIAAAVRRSIDAVTDNMASGDAETNSTFVVQFKEDILRKIDTGLSLKTADVFETLLDKIANKHQNDLTSMNEQYTELLQRMERLATELTSVNDEVAQTQEQLQRKEEDYNLLKSQKEKMHEISNAVTLDIVKKEQALSETITQGCKQLIEHNIMNPDEIDFTSSMNKNVQTIFERLIKQSVAQNQNSELENEKQKLELAVKKSTCLLQEKASECDALSTEIANLKTANADLKSELEAKISAINSNNEQVEDMKQEIHRLRNQIECNEKIIKTLESEQDERMDSDDLSDWMHKASVLETENNKLRTLHEEIEKQREEYALELEKAGKDIQNYKTDIENMTTHIKVLQNSLESMKCETKEITDMKNNLKADKEELAIKLEELNKQCEEKNQECSRLKLHMKTHEKTAEIQSNIIKRLKSEKEDDNKTIAEKEKRIAELQTQLQTSKESIQELQTIKDTLEIRLSELENEAKDEQKGRTSIDAVSSSVRRRRQSSQDSRRMVDMTGEDQDSKLEAMFPARPAPDDLFSDGHSSGRSTPLGRRRDSLLRDSVEASPPRAHSAVRRRRQSLHDAARDVHTPEPAESKPKSSETADNMSEVQVRERIAFLEKENEELRERYREVDEECETCAQYLREREAQCARLAGEVRVLEKTIADLKSQDSTLSGPRSGEPKRSFASVAVNTDEDWSNLHSVVVDRMSFDLEVDKNKKLRRAIEEFRMKNRDLRATVLRLQEALERHAAKDVSKELEKLKEELSSLKQENKKLYERNSELDEECNTFEVYLKERDDAIARLKFAKTALEAKLEEGHDASRESAQSARRKRHSLHDRARARAARADAAVGTGDDLLSYHVERDTSSRLSAEYEAQIVTLNMTIKKLSSQKAELEKRLAISTSAPQLCVATGSGIVQNQQLTDLSKENQKLKKQNAKLLDLCKKRGKTADPEA